MGDEGGGADAIETEVVGVIVTASDIIALRDRPGSLATLTPDLIEPARASVDTSRPASTGVNNGQLWAAFAAWCREHNQASLPAEPSLAAAGPAPQTLALRLAAINHAHRSAGEVAPHERHGGTFILNVLAGARRVSGKPSSARAAVEGDMVWAMLREN